MRTLAWDGLVNVRELGGLPTEDGGETRRGALVRSENPRGLSEAGWAAVVEHGVRTVIDLRFREELDLDAPRDTPVEVVHVPLIDGTRQDYFVQIVALADSTPDAAGFIRESYRWLLAEPANLAAAIRAFAAARPGGVLVHCAGGKDRTGVVVALILRLAGVSIDEVVADYEVSEQHLRAYDDRWVEEAADAAERERRLRYRASPGEAMRDVLEELERDHGGARGYLLSAGLADEELDRIRERLLGPA